MGLLNREIKGGKEKKRDRRRQKVTERKRQREIDREKDGNKRQEYVEENHQVRINFNVKHVPL